MSRRSTIDRMPSDVRSRVRQFMLESPHLTLDEATAELNRRGIAISRSVVHRYRADLEREDMQNVSPGSLVVLVIDPQTAHQTLLTITADRSELLSHLAALYPPPRFSCRN